MEDALGSSGGPCTHWKAPPCHGARAKQTVRTRHLRKLKCYYGRAAFRRANSWISSKKMFEQFEPMGVAECLSDVREASEDALF